MANEQGNRPTWSGSVLDPGGRSLLDADTRVATEPGASGGSAARTSFESSPGMARRWRRTISAEEVEGQGPFEVWAAVRADPDVEAEIQLRWGASDPSAKAERSLGLAPGATEAEFRAARLGRAEPDRGQVVLEGWAARHGGSGTLSWDRLWLAPAGSSFVPPVLPLPVSPGGGPPPGSPTLPRSTIGPALPAAAGLPTMPRPGRARRIALVAGLVVAVIAAAVAVPLALSGDDEAPTSASGGRPSPGPAEESPSPVPTEQANFSGAFDVTITIASLSSKVQGLSVGDTATSTWILRSTCPSGPCPTELIGADFYGTGVKATGDLEGGVFQGTTQSSLQCTDTQTGEVLFEYTGPGDFRIQITEAATVDGVARAVAFEGQFVFRYQAQGAPSGDCPATLVERDSISGTLLQAPS
jgi:hypothetical protein